MLVTVLWEDQASTGNAFGPGKLLIHCLADDLRQEPHEIASMVESQPRKGNASVLRALKNDCRRLTRSGPVIVVLDSDRAPQLLQSTSACLKSMAQRLSRIVDCKHEVVFLRRNMESLLDAVVDVLREPTSCSKPRPTAWSDASWASTGTTCACRYAAACPTSIAWFGALERICGTTRGRDHGEGGGDPPRVPCPALTPATDRAPARDRARTRSRPRR